MRFNISVLFDAAIGGREDISRFETGLRRAKMKKFFRANAFGWKGSELAIQRIKEAGPKPIFELPALNLFPETSKFSLSQG
jgi:hypothetical protein